MNWRVVISVIVSGLAVVPVQSAELLVPEDYSTINDAIYFASNGDSISVGPGTHQRTWGTAVIGNSSKSLHIYGRDGSSVTTLNGGGGTGILLSGSATSNSLIEGFAITNSSPGVWLYQSSATLRDVHIVGCSNSAFGGGLKVQGGQPSFEDGSIQQCWTSSSYGGGVSVESGASLSMTDVLIDANDAPFRGGGVSLTSSHANMTRCVISNNTVSSIGASGGGISVDTSSSVSMSGCLLQGNLADNGGGLYSDGNGLRVYAQGCLFLSNTASYGGGLYSVSSVSLGLCVFGANLGNSAGGGVLLGGGGYIDACEFISNSAGSGAAVYSNGPPVTIGSSQFCADPPSSETVVGSVLYADGNIWACPCQGDVNADGLFTSVDLLEMLRWFGTDCVESQLDRNQDGLISVPDLLLLLQAWGPC
jgi:hypothetical protein